MGMATAKYWTAEIVRALPDDGTRHEVVYGELLVTPAPRMLHQLVVHRLTFALSAYLQSNPVGLAFGVPGDITWGREDVLVQPDIFVARLDEARTLDWEAIRHLLLVVEVLSPSSVKQDRFTKRRRYQDAGVPLYWIVDVEGYLVEQWTSADAFPQVQRERLRWEPAGAESPFTLELTELFRPI